MHTHIAVIINLVLSPTTQPYNLVIFNIMCIFYTIDCSFILFKIYNMIDFRNTEKHFGYSEKPNNKHYVLYLAISQYIFKN